MPAVTVGDVLLLPRIAEPYSASAQQCPVLGGNRRAVGSRGRGIPRPPCVRGVGLRALDPFIHVDQMGEVGYSPGEPKGSACRRAGLQSRTATSPAA